MSRKKQQIEEDLPKPNEQDEIETTEMMIPLGLIEVSPFEPQVMRRKHFKTDDDGQLAASIKSQGLLSPIVVRPNPPGSKSKATYQIVAGERRFRATKLTGATEIRAFVRIISDDDALEIQMQENLQRVQPDPLEEAFSFGYLIKHNGLTVTDVATKFGRKVHLVQRRLKLNDLIPEALKDIADGYLPLGHAEEIALYPADAQKRILEKHAYKWDDKKDGFESLEKMKKEIHEDIVMHLPSAIFSKEATDLHPKNLACFDCPERTGFTPKLFDPQITKDDHCLNRVCFENKQNTHIRNVKKEVGEMLREKFVLMSVMDEKEIAEAVPMISDSWIYGEATLKNRYGDGVFVEHAEYFDQPECEKSSPGVVINGDAFGSIKYFCTDEKCETHGTGKSEKDSGRSKWQLQSKEKEWNVKVSQETRARIFTNAIKTFDNTQTFWMYDDLIKDLIANLWNRTYNTKDSLINLLSGLNWENFPKKPKDEKVFRKFIDTLDKQKQSQILFLLITADVGYSTWQEVDQSGVKEIAHMWTDFDYAHVDAKTRLDLTPEEFKAMHKEYLAKIEDGEEIEPPKLFLTAELLAKFEAEEAAEDDDDDDEDSDDENFEDEDTDEDEIDENDLGETSQG